MFSSDLLKGRAIFLSGGGSGLGRSMAIAFTKLGARLFLIGRREDPLKETCAEIHSLGGAAAFTTCDVRDYALVEAAFAAAEAQFGEIDSLVNNAAGNFMARTEKLSPNAFNSVVGIVLNGTFHCTQAFAKRRIQKTRRQYPEYHDHVCLGEFGFGIRRAFGVRQGRRLGDDHFARRRVGQISHPRERHRAWPISDRRRVVPPDALKTVRRACHQQAPHEALRQA